MNSLATISQIAGRVTDQQHAEWSEEDILLRLETRHGAHLCQLPRCFNAPWKKFLEARVAISRLAWEESATADTIRAQLEQQWPVDGKKTELWHSLNVSDSIKVQIAVAAGLEREASLYHRLGELRVRRLLGQHKFKSHRRQPVYAETWQPCVLKLWEAYESALELARRQEQACQSLLQQFLTEPDPSSVMAKLLMNLRERDYVSLLILAIMGLDAHGEVYRATGLMYEDKLQGAGFVLENIIRPPIWGENRPVCQFHQGNITYATHQKHYAMPVGRTSPLKASESFPTHLSPRRVSQKETYQTPPVPFQPKGILVNGSGDQCASARGPSDTPKLDWFAPSPWCADTVMTDVGEVESDPMDIDSPRSVFGSMVASALQWVPRFGIMSAEELIYILDSIIYNLKKDWHEIRESGESTKRYGNMSDSDFGDPEDSDDDWQWRRRCRSDCSCSWRRTGEDRDFQESSRGWKHRYDLDDTSSDDAGDFRSPWRRHRSGCHGSRKSRFGHDSIRRRDRKRHWRHR